MGLFYQADDQLSYSTLCHENYSLHFDFTTSEKTYLSINREHQLSFITLAIGSVFPTLMSSSGN
jgi:hypothetical protein